MNRYVPQLRPASFATLPFGVGWFYVEAPALHGLANRPDLPQSRHRYGVIETTRPLTDREREHFDMVPEDKA